MSVRARVSLLQALLRRDTARGNARETWERDRDRDRELHHCGSTKRDHLLTMSTQQPSLNSKPSALTPHHTFLH